MNEPENNELKHRDSESGDEFAGQAKQLFDDSVERLDAATLSRLNQGRQKALAELKDKGSAGHWLRWAPLTGVAAAVLVAVAVLQIPSAEVQVAPATNVTDFEILMGEDSLEMLEDLEFYSWIDPAELELNGNVG